MSANVNHGERAHAKFGASSSKLWLNCYGWYRMTRDLPPSPDSPASREGTAAHEVIDLSLQNGCVSGIRYLNTRRSNGIQVTREMVKAVDVMLDAVWREVGRYDDSELKSETKLTLEHVAPRMFGTGDVLIYSPSQKLLLVMDYKHGKGVYVSEKHNPQLLYYGEGARKFYELQGLRVETVRCAIVQPRFGNGKEPVRWAEYDLVDLFEFTLEVRHAWEEAQKPDAPCNPGPWCDDNFCQARDLCKSYRNKARAGAADGFEAV